MRPPRVTQGPSGTLPAFSERQAAGQAWLYRINGRNHEELYVGFEQLTSDLMIVISSEKLVVFGLVEGHEKAVLTVGFFDLELARPVCQRDTELGLDTFQVEIVMRTQGRDGRAAPSFLQRPQVRCEGQLVAESVCNTINHAKSQWEEARMTVFTEGEEERE